MWHRYRHGGAGSVREITDGDRPPTCRLPAREPAREGQPRGRARDHEAQRLRGHDDQPAPDRGGMNLPSGREIVDQHRHDEQVGESEERRRPHLAHGCKPRDRRARERDGRERHQPLVRVGPVTLHQARAAYERDYILKKLDENHGNVSRTAEVLGLERSHMYRKMKALGIAVKE